MSINSLWSICYYGYFVCEWPKYTYFQYEIFWLLLTFIRALSVHFVDISNIYNNYYPFVWISQLFWIAGTLMSFRKIVIFWLWNLGLFLTLFKNNTLASSKFYDESESFFKFEKFENLRPKHRILGNGP